MTTPITIAQQMNPAAANRTPANPFQPAGPVAQNAEPGSNERGLCTLTHNKNVFRFRTNPNAVWWSYELITHVDQTYGGRVVQVLGTRLGDLSVKVECGLGGWEYLMKVVNYLRNVLTDQRNGQTATFEYTARNWKLKVYALNLPFQDEVTATTREIELQFKIQEDINSVLSSATLNADLARLQRGIYRPGISVHNEYNDGTGGAAQSPLDALAKVVPEIALNPYDTTTPSNTVDTSPQGTDSTGLGALGIGLDSIPLIGPLLGGITKLGGLL